VQAHAPGHGRPRCVYVDFLNTGPAVSKTLRTAVNRTAGIRKAGDLCVVDLIVVDGEVAGAVALHVASGSPVRISAKATIIATGGLTRLYRRNSASTNMGGDGYALALRAGVSLIDMEFVQFFPIGHLAPRLIGMDPIMWDPFRYKLGGVYLSFQHCSEAALRGAFGPVIDRLAANGIDLTRTPVEVAPIAHYHMGGIVADAAMATEIPGLFAAGEVVGGANGANRLSGNAITEALVFGRQAGRSAAARAKSVNAPIATEAAARPSVDFLGMDAGSEANTAAMVQRLQATMADDVGPFRDAAKLTRALAAIDEMTRDLGDRPASSRGAFDMQRLDWLDLRNMLIVARSVAQAALARTESRGAHQREDHAVTRPEWQLNQVVRWRNGELSLGRTQVAAEVPA